MNIGDNVVCRFEGRTVTGRIKRILPIDGLIPGGRLRRFNVGFDSEQSTKEQDTPITGHWFHESLAHAEGDTDANYIECLWLGRAVGVSSKEGQNQ